MFAHAACDLHFIAKGEGVQHIHERNPDTALYVTQQVVIKCRICCPGNIHVLPTPG